jgi:hypothetical protein
MAQVEVQETNIQKPSMYMVYDNVCVTELSCGEIQEEIDFTYQERKRLAQKVNTTNNGIWGEDDIKKSNLMEIHIKELYNELSRRDMMCRYCTVHPATLFDEYCADCYWDNETK